MGNIGDGRMLFVDDGTRRAMVSCGAMRAMVSCGADEFSQLGPIAPHRARPQGAASSLTCDGACAQQCSCVHSQAQALQAARCKNSAKGVGGSGVAERRPVVQLHANLVAHTRTCDGVHVLQCARNLHAHHVAARVTDSMVPCFIPPPLAYPGAPLTSMSTP